MPFSFSAGLFEILECDIIGVLLSTVNDDFDMFAGVTVNGFAGTIIAVGDGAVVVILMNCDAI